ncbi:hypothetical protein DXH95_10100 [Sphingorhabdus pulchriflava]|uniref:Beta/gamma crystallin 'Greek key' domain-containing protein n=1 Tax=Sphingorhabdus pulchriflava TaxID=2292257 RepID=A0A371BJ92_9SPHN|nr:beta/gamma crystallin-related protein [Sphingorhabdus pulchriflava]RDV07654.1 hypothetical protein DXH95_10100 [Sphingorhabdus pulchriflava]
MKVLVSAVSLAVLGLTGAALVSQPGYSQSDPEASRFMVQPEATIYRDAGYRGPAVFVGEEERDLGLNWRVNAIRVKSGRWQLCERTNFRGTCHIFDSSQSMLDTPFRGLVIQSMRPIGGGIGGGGGGMNDGGPSLRGLSSQYYAQPTQYGFRVRACAGISATASCAARNADTFCRQMGWNGAAWQTMETVNRVTYLSDVLCTRTGY